MGENCGFEPILCFARNARQTPDEVFDMLQERMMALLGKAYADKGMGTCVWDGKASEEESGALSDWQASSVLLTAEDFDRLGAPLGLSMADVLGRPRVPKAYGDAIARRIKASRDAGIDPVACFVTLSAFDRIGDMVADRKAMSETQREGMA